MKHSSDFVFKICYHIFERKKIMKITFEKFYDNLDELKKYSLTTPEETAALVANILNIYTPETQTNFFELLQYLMGDIQPLSNLLKQQINDRMTQNEKWKFIGKSYFLGSKPDNDYEPTKPYEVEINENSYSYSDAGFARLFLKSSGADNSRPITLRKTKDGKWLLWSDSILGLLVDIRKPESQNPWM